MKFIRKIIALLIGVVFFAALIISIGMIFAVKNINVTLVTYAEEYEEDYLQAKEKLSVFQGESILFLNENEVSAVIDGSNYSLVSFEKKYPCTINVTLRERLETFAVLIGGVYSFYDNEGKYLRKGSENLNPDDGMPDVEITGVSSEEIGYIAGIAQMFKDSFGSLRSLVTAVNLDTKPLVEGYTEKLVFYLRCGLKIQLDDYSDRTQEKIEAAYSKFSKLSDRDKLNGTLRSYLMGGEDGLINADYLPV